MTGSPACAGDDSPCSRYKNRHATHQAAVSRRSCRKPPASGRPQGGARQARARRDHRRRAQDDRRPRDRDGHPQAGGGGPSLRDRRRVSPCVLELRFPRRDRRRRSLSRRAQDQVPGSAAQAHDAARDRQARRLPRASDDRSFQIRRRPCQGDAEDDHSLALVAAFPLWARRGAGRHLSRYGRFLSRPRRGLSQGGAGLQRRRLPLSPARRGQFHLSLRSQAARVRRQPRRGSGDASARLCPHDQRRAVRCRRPT